MWWVDFEPARGGEIRKVRPAIIVSNDAANRNLNRVVVVPLTSNVDKVYPGEALVHLGPDLRKAMADQLTTVSKERLSGRVGQLGAADIRRVEEALRVQSGLT